MTLPEQIRLFNARLDLTSLEAVLQTLGVARTAVHEDAGRKIFIIESDFFGASGRLVYRPADDAQHASLTFHAESGDGIRLSRAELVAAFPDWQRINATNRAPSGGFSVYGPGNAIHFGSNDVNAEELEISILLFFEHQLPPVSNGVAFPIDAIKSFIAQVDLGSAEDVCARLGIGASDAQWVSRTEGMKSFLAVGNFFGGFRRLSYAQTTAGPELIFGVKDGAPVVSREALLAAFPLESSPAGGAYIMRDGANRTIFTCNEIETDQLLVTGFVFVRKE